MTADIIELTPAQYFSLSIGVTHESERLANIQDGQTLRLPARDERNFCYFSRVGSTVRVQIDGDILSTMKVFVGQFYNRLEMIETSTSGQKEAMFTMEQWERIWAHHPASIVIIDVS